LGSLFHLRYVMRHVGRMIIDTISCQPRSPIVSFLRKYLPMRCRLDDLWHIVRIVPARVEGSAGVVCHDEGVRVRRPQLRADARQ
jgi:hypothetical protein